MLERYEETLDWIELRKVATRKVAGTYGSLHDRQNMRLGRGGISCGRNVLWPECLISVGYMS